MNVAACGHAQAALQRSGKVGNDVAKHVIGDDDVELPRIANHLQAERVHVHVLRLDLGILARHNFEHALPQAVRVRKHVRLVAHKYSWLVPRAHMLSCVIKCESDNTFYAFSRVYILLDSNFISSSLLERSANINVNALSVLANDGEIYVGRLNVLERAERLVLQLDWAHVGI